MNPWQPLASAHATARLGARHHLVVGGAGAAHADVVHHRVVEQVVVLLDERDACRKLRRGQVVHRHAADAHLARARVPEPGDEARERRLPRAGRPHERCHLARLDGQIDAVDHLFAPVGEPHAGKLDACAGRTSGRGARRIRRAALLRLVENRRYLLHHGADLGQRVDEVHGRVQGREYGQRQDGHHDERRRLERALQNEQASHRQHGHERGRPDGQAQILEHLHVVHPVDERMRVAVHGLRELLVRAGRLAERLDDLDAVDVLDRSRAHVLACAHGFLVPEVVVLHHAHVGGEPDGQRDERDERHAPIEREHERDDGQRNQQIRRHLRQQVRERRLDAVHLLHHDVLELARRRVQHVAERHARELFGDEPADPRDRRERRDVREGRRGVVEHEVGPVACGGRRAPAQVESEVAHVPQHADDHLAGGVVGHDGARHAHDG